MSAVDPRFREARRRAQGRHRGSRWIWVVLILVLVALSGAGAAWLWWPRPVSDISVSQGGPAETAILPNPAAESVAGLADLPDTLTLPPQQAESLPPEEAEGPRASLDLPGDPILLVLGNAVAPQSQTLPRPQSLDAARGQGELVLARGPLLPPGERIAVALPSSQEDFAIFQGQRQQASQIRRASLPGAALERPPRSVAEARAWVAARIEGDSLSYGANDLALRPAHARHVAWRDLVLRVDHASDLSDLLRLENLSAPDVDAAVSAAEDHLGGRVTQAGSLLALRLHAGSGALVQMALYTGERYVGAVARSEAAPAGPEGGVPGPVLRPGSDPWLRHDLPARLATGQDRADAALPANAAAPRVMDALYDAGLRHGFSPGLVGQIIMLLSQTYKLDMPARPTDRFEILRTAQPPQGDDSAALDQVLFMGVQAEGLDLKCYVYRPAPDRPPACYGQRRAGVVAGAASPAPPLPDGSAQGPAQGPALGPALGPAQGLTASDAVEQLVNRIIQVESAGRADARNPLSTATGLGQFIDSTWLRMMRTYRPDLTATLSRGELLALRTDPGISRAMVLNLAREGESYLRARGHDITAGRLYLAHFLGMDGAHVALSADPAAPLITLFGAGVINANPFLRGQNAAYVVDWAERKMQGRGARYAARISEPAGLAAFRDLVDAALQGTRAVE